MKTTTQPIGKDKEFENWKREKFLEMEKRLQEKLNQKL